MKTLKTRITSRGRVVAVLPVAVLLAGVVAFTTPGDAVRGTDGPRDGTLTRLSVTPHVIAAGGTATGTVRRSTTVGNTVVDLASRNTSVATVPSRITIDGRTSTESFTVNGMRGEGGCTTISARSGRASSVQAKIAVAPAPTTTTNPRLTNVSLRFGSQSGLADMAFDGQTLTGTVTLSVPTLERVRVSLGSNVPGELDMPSSVDIAPRGTSASFTVKQRSPGNVDCAVVTASLGSVTAKRLVLFWASPEGW